MAVLLMLILMISPVASIVMIVSQRKIQMELTSITKKVEHIIEVNSMSNDSIKSKDTTMESISTNEGK